MYKIGIIGSAQTVSLFSTLGYVVMEAEDVDAARSQLQLAVKSDEYAVLFLEECYFVALSDELERCARQPLPAVTVLPGKSGGQGLGSELLKRAMERAVGTDVP
ncbi:MAG: V-type ATP synthase subunit F [Clostridia bacterium]|nr:V-type ATP synthase subunit F [Clostridia bacterium]